MLDITYNGNSSLYEFFMDLIDGLDIEDCEDEIVLSVTDGLGYLYAGVEPLRIFGMPDVPLDFDILVDITDTKLINVSLYISDCENSIAIDEFEMPYEYSSNNTQIENMVYTWFFEKVG